MLASRGPGVRLREAAAADADTVLLLCGGLGRPAPDAADVAQRAAAERILDDPDTLVLLAEEAGGAVVGLACVALLPRLGWATPEARLLDLYVEDGARAVGVGRRLVEACAAFARRRGCHVLRLECGHARVGAHGFYERLGFADRGRDYQLPL